MKRSVCKSLCLLLTFALLVCALPAASLAAIRTEAEDNDTYQKANPVDLGDTVRGTISSSNDVDYYKITPSESGYLTLRVSHAYLEDASADWSLTVYRFTNSLEQIYDTRIEGTVPETALPKIGVEPGAYYIEVTRGYSFDAVRDVEYHLSVSQTKTDWWEAEPNGNYTAANPFTPGQTYGGFIGDMTDKDFFKVTVTEKGYLNIKVEHEYLEDAAAEWTVEVYRFTTDLKSLTSEDIPGTSVSTSLPRLGVEPGTYYVSVTRGYSFDAVQDVEYHLTVGFSKNALLLGDLDLDGSITASDARLALRGAVGLEHFNADFTAIGDVDFDGKITAADARKILRAAVGLETL